MEPSKTNQLQTTEDQVDQNAGLSPKRFKKLLAYTVALLVVFFLSFFYAIVETPFLEKKTADSVLIDYANVSSEKVQAKSTKPSADSLTKPAASKATTTTVKASSSKVNIKIIMIYLLVLMSISGVLGACLANLRGFFYHYMYEGKFPKVKEIPYYVRPPIAALTGLFVFFLGSFLNSSFSYDTGIPKWITLTGSIPSLAFAFLSGFACLELMSRLKQVAESIFGYTPKPTTTNTQSNDQKNTLVDISSLTEKSLLLETIKSRGIPDLNILRPTCNGRTNLDESYFIGESVSNVIVDLTNGFGKIAGNSVSLDDVELSNSFPLNLGKASDLLNKKLTIVSSVQTQGSNSDKRCGAIVAIQGGLVSKTFELCKEAEEGEEVIDFIFMITFRP